MNVLSSFPFERCVVVQAEETPYTAFVIVKMFDLERLKRITKIQSSKSNFIITKSIAIKQVKNKELRIHKRRHMTPHYSRSRRY